MTAARRIAPAVGFVLCAAALGLLTVSRPIAALAVAGSIVVFALARGIVGGLIGLAVFGTLALPTGWGVERLLRTEIGVGSFTTPAQVALPILCTVLIVALLIARRVQLPQMSRDARRFSLGVFAFLIACAIPMAIGLIDGRTVGLIYRDARPLFIYAFGVALIAAVRARFVSVRAIITAAAAGLLFYCCFVIAVFFDPGMRGTIYSGMGDWATGTRVGFGTTSLLVLAIPLALAGLVSPAMQRGVRLALAALLALMVATLFISQSRSTIIAAGLGVLAYLLLSRQEGRGRSRRARLVFVLLLAACVVVAVIALTPSGASLLKSIEERGMISASGPSTRTRLLTFEAALTQARGASLVLGQGFGTLLQIISSEGSLYGSALFVDNALITTMLKGGVVLVLGLLGLLLGFTAQLFTARRVSAGDERAAWDSLVGAVPWFLVVVVVASAHILNSPAVAMGISLLGAVAALRTQARAEADAGG